MLRVAAIAGLLLLVAVRAQAGVVCAGSARNTDANNPSNLALVLPMCTQSSGLFYLAQVSYCGAGVCSTITNNSVPAGWTQIGTPQLSGNNASVLFWHVSTTAEPASYTWGFSGNASASGGIIAFSNVLNSNPIDTFSSSNGVSPT